MLLTKAVKAVRVVLVVAWLLLMRRRPSSFWLPAICRFWKPIAEKRNAKDYEQQT